MSTWSEYVDKLSGSEPQKTVAEKTGIDGSTISRWRNGAPAGKPAHVARFAQEYGGNVLEAFVAAGFLTEDEAHLTPTSRPDITLVPSHELSEELTRRARFADTLRQTIAQGEIRDNHGDVIDDPERREEFIALLTTAIAEPDVGSRFLAQLERAVRVMDGEAVADEPEEIPIPGELGALVEKLASRSDATIDAYNTSEDSSPSAFIRIQAERVEPDEDDDMASLHDLERQRRAAEAHKKRTQAMNDALAANADRPVAAQRGAKEPDDQESPAGG